MKPQKKSFLDKIYDFICGVVGTIFVIGLAVYCGIKKPRSCCPTCKRPYE